MTAILEGIPLYLFNTRFTFSEILVAIISTHDKRARCLFPPIILTID